MTKAEPSVWQSVRLILFGVIFFAVTVQAGDKDMSKEELKKKLNQHVNVVQSGLENCGLAVKQLTTRETTELFYQCYNPLTARQQKVDEVEKLQIVSDADLGR